MLVWSENEKTSIYSGREFPSEWNKFFVNKKIILIIKPCQDRMPFHVKVSFFFTFSWSCERFGRNVLYFIKCERSFSTRGRAQIKAKSKQDFIFDLCVENSVNLWKRSSNQIHIYIENCWCSVKVLNNHWYWVLKIRWSLSKPKFTFSVFWFKTTYSTL